MAWRPSAATERRVDHAGPTRLPRRDAPRSAAIRSRPTCTTGAPAPSSGSAARTTASRCARVLRAAPGLAPPRRPPARRTARMALFSRVGCTRFVRRITNSFRSGSIHIDVPVKPVWPNERGGAEQRRPPRIAPSGVSQPSARAGAGHPGRRVNRSTVSRDDDPPVLEDAAVQQHLREARQVGRGAEEPGVRGHAAHGEGVLVVHLARAPPGPRQGSFSVGAIRARSAGRRLVAACPSSPGARGSACRAKASSGSARHALQDLAQQDAAPGRCRATCVPGS